MDYVAVGCLLLSALVAISFTFVVNILGWIRTVLCTRKGWEQLLCQQRDTEVVANLPSYLKLYAHRNLLVYVIAYAIGIFQLGAVALFSVHRFCDILDRVYNGLDFIGLIERTSGQSCWESQMSHSHNLIVLWGCFLYLTICFWIQVMQQYNFNVKQASRLLRQNGKSLLHWQIEEGASNAGNLVQVWENDADADGGGVKSKATTRTQPDMCTCAAATLSTGDDDQSQSSTEVPTLSKSESTDSILDTASTSSSLDADSAVGEDDSEERETWEIEV